MKKIAILFLLSFWIFAFANAEEEIMLTTTSFDNSSSKICEEVWWEFVTLESYPVQEKCNINWTSISIDSFKDKYNHFVLWMMINYKSEYKYSDEKKWKSYLEFFAQDIEDTKIFRDSKITDEQKTKIGEELKVQESLYNFMKVKSDLWEKNANDLEKALTNYESKFKNETDLNKFHKLLQTKLKAKIEEMEKLQMVAKFTPEWYKVFLLKLNAYKYLKILVDWRLE